MTPKIALCTPIYSSPEAGSVTIAYHRAVLDVYRLGVTATLSPRLGMACDLARARSRAASMVIDSDCTHLLFWDSDVGGDCVTALRGMIGSDVDVIACPFPRKALIGDGRAMRPTHHPNGWMPMGFTLIKRDVLVAMRDRYKDELFYLEEMPGHDTDLHPRIGLFLPMIRNRQLLGEDYAFCQRWLDMGGSIHLYEGPGAPLVHVGALVFSPTRAEMGIAELGAK